jgi:hypothetical protein
MKKRVIVKISLNPGHPADAELIKRLDAIEGNIKSTHLKLAAFHYFGILDQLVKANNPNMNGYADISKQRGNDNYSGINDNDRKRDDPLDGSSIFASAFDNT